MAVTFTKTNEGSIASKMRKAKSNYAKGLTPSGKRISSGGSSGSKDKLTRGEVIELAKSQGILDSQGRIKQGRLADWERLSKQYKDIKGAENLASIGMATPGVQKVGSDRETTKETLRSSARITAERLAQGKALRGDFSETSVTVQSKALMDEPKKVVPNQFGTSTPYNPTGPFKENAPKEPEPMTFSDISPRALLAKGAAFLSDPFNKKDKSNLPESVQEFASDTPLEKTSQTFETYSRAITKGQKKYYEDKGFKILEGGYILNPETNKLNVQQVSASTPFAYITPSGGGQLVGAMQTGKFTETAARTIYASGKAAAIYTLLSKETPKVAAAINPDFKQVYDNPDFKQALKTAKEAEIQASASEKFKVGGVNIPLVKGLVEQIPFVSFNKDVYEQTLLNELKGSGLSDDQILRAAGLQKFASDAGATVAAISIEQSSELFGRQGISQAARMKGPQLAIGATQARATIGGVVKGPLQRAGIVEGVSASVLYDVTQDQEINPLRAAIGGAVGGIVAGEVGTFIAKTRLGKKGVSYTTEAAVDIIDLPELPGDIAASSSLRNLKKQFARGSFSGIPGLSGEDLIPSNLGVGRVRTPVGINLFGIGAQAPDISPTITPIKTKAETINPSVPVPQPFGFTVPTQGNIPTVSETFVPQPVPTPVPVTVSVPTTTPVVVPNPNIENVPENVPVFAPENVPNQLNIPTTVPDKFPWLPPFGGSVKNKKLKTRKVGSKGATRTIFQNIFRGVDLKPITAPKGKERTGLILRG